MSAAAKLAAVLVALLGGVAVLTGCGPSLEDRRAEWKECFETAADIWVEAADVDDYADRDSMADALIRDVTAVCGERPS